jgi:hypothetical protein
MLFLYFSIEKAKVNENTLSLLINVIFICYISVGQRCIIILKLIYIKYIKI